MNKIDKVYTITKSVRVKNVVGSSKTSPKCANCGDWIDHWNQFSGKLTGDCRIKGCTNKATVGAHVTRPLAKDKNLHTHHYIIPMCREHNGKHGEEFDTKDHVTFVWANVAETCSKL